MNKAYDVVVHASSIAQGKTSVASANIAKWLAEYLDIELVSRGGRFKHARYSTIFYVNSMGAFAEPELRTELAFMVKHCDTMVWIQNDYHIQPISQVQKVLRERGWAHNCPFRDLHNPVTWTTTPDQITPGSRSTYVNWNQLTWCPTPRTRIITAGRRKTKNALFYFGACRPGRTEYFKKYFVDPPYDAEIMSTTTEKYRELGVTVPLLNGRNTNIISIASGYRAALYIEDEYSHTTYCSLANRFYEYLSAGVAILFDVSCINTLEKAGLKSWENYIVEKPEDIPAKLRMAKSIALRQQTYWTKPFIKLLCKQVDAARKKL